MRLRPVSQPRLAALTGEGTRGNTPGASGVLSVPWLLPSLSFPIFTEPPAPPQPSLQPVCVELTSKPETTEGAL